MPPPPEQKPSPKPPPPDVYEPTETPAEGGQPLRAGGPLALVLSSAASIRKETTRIPWAELLARTFRVDVLECPECAGPMRVIAYLTDPLVTSAILDHLGLPRWPPTPSTSPREPQLHLDS